ncbi:helix-turn-helix transcriptional regulator [Mycoplasma sp. CSL10137]|uniref:helix-turn-helix domain-containing protein n=1 Tax=Mycoplasma sp. CSL10137 TaxID=2813824 RepID=UPI00197B2789|nr:helix-turn-helix transcriptional regulator [Mycoplasma sp. CSL10137]MBN4083815.1 helix-turn-helix transcriptional regulator [Mycoplasma sp. CSL10137]
MKFSYKPLWKLLIDREMSNKDLINITDISKSTLHKLKTEKNVNTNILLKICNALKCDISKIIECVEEKND